jgi:hypothetical protein
MQSRSDSHQNYFLFQRAITHRRLDHHLPLIWLNESLLKQILLNIIMS